MRDVPNILDSRVRGNDEGVTWEAGIGVLGESPPLSVWKRREPCLVRLRSAEGSASAAPRSDPLNVRPGGRVAPVGRVLAPRRLVLCPADFVGALSVLLV